MISIRVFPSHPIVYLAYIYTIVRPFLFVKCPESLKVSFKSHHDAQNVIDLIFDNKLEGYITANSVTDIYYIAKKHLNHNDLRNTMMHYEKPRDKY